MSKRNESNGSPDENVKLNSADRSELDNDSENFTEHELFNDFDEKRRSFLKKLLISAAYITPAILSFSIRDSEARAKKLPTRKNVKRKREES